MKKRLIFIIITCFYAHVLMGKGVPVGTIITNKSSVQYKLGLIFTNVMDTVSTQVMAIYGMNQFTSSTLVSTYPGGIGTFNYAITNNSNINLKLFVTMSNFSTMSSNSVTNWYAYITGFNTSRTVSGTNSQYKQFTNTIHVSNMILPGSIFPYSLNIQTSPNSQPLHSGWLPLVTQVTSTNVGIRARYTGDNGGLYGGTNYRIEYPKVVISAPFILLRKTMSISNMPLYLANGGRTNIPVPDTIITYTNFYENTGNASATNLIIIDRIPYHSDFITGSLNVSSIHSNALVTPDTSNPREIRLTFTGASVKANNSNPLPRDTDAGYFYYKVRVHRRE